MPLQSLESKTQSLNTGSPVNQADQESLRAPTSETLFAFARDQQGEILLTLQRKSPFRVEVVGNFLEITPSSSKTPRRESRENIAALLAQFAKTVSFQMSDYRELTFNASYILALVKRWQLSVR